MFGNDLKIGKTDYYDNEDKHIVTDTTKKVTKDGKSIWTVTEQVDFDNDDKFDEISVTTVVYNKKNKIVEKNIEFEGDSLKISSQIKYDEKERSIEENELMYDPNNEDSLVKTNTKNIYETATGNHVKTIIVTEKQVEDDPSTYEVDSKVYNFEYDKNGKVKKITTETDEGNDGSVDNVETAQFEYYENGKRKTKSVATDIGNNGTIDKRSVSNFAENGRLIQTETDKSIQTIEYCDEQGVANVITKDKKTSCVVKEVYKLDEHGIDWLQEPISKEVLNEGISQNEPAQAPAQEPSLIHKAERVLKKTAKYVKNLF